MPKNTKSYRSRETTASRGYGARHQALRKQLIAAWGRRPCVRCGEPILPRQPVDLDHDDEDRSRYLGISHASCNRSAGIKMKNERIRQLRRDPRPKPATKW